MISVLYIVGSRHWSCQTKDHIIDVCCFSTKHAALRSKSWNQDNRSNVEIHVYTWTVVSLI